MWVQYISIKKFSLKKFGSKGFLGQNSFFGPNFVGQIFFVVISDCLYTLQYKFSELTKPHNLDVGIWTRAPFWLHRKAVEIRGEDSFLVILVK